MTASIQMRCHLRWLLLSSALGILSGSMGAEVRREPAMEERSYEEEIVFDFEPSTEPWQNIDDPVMGGQSRSTMRIDGGIAAFEGIVSLENNGGVASLRSRPAEHDLGSFAGLVLRVSGDGKTSAGRPLPAGNRLDQGLP